MLWSNGGPGASSAFGLFTEFGPLQLTGDSLATNPPTLFRNPYSWTKLANVIILNGPAPVGYSYCTPAGPSGDGYACGSWNDTRTAEFNYNFITNFFAEEYFPEFKAAPFFIAGESYAGVYVGQLTSLLLATTPVPVNLRGIALGDACMGTETLCGPGGARGPWLGLLFAAGQGCISLPTFRAMITLCPLEILEQGPISSAPADCQAAVAAAGRECPSNAYYTYNYLDQCPPSVFLRDGDEPTPTNNVSGYPCGGDQALKAWVSLPEVKAALHVAADATFNSFDNGAGFVYNLTWESNLPLMRRLQTGADGVRVMVYEGETDPSISSVKAQNWTYSLGFPQTEAWRPWTFPNSTVVAGSVVQFAGDFVLATVRGAGHMCA